MGQALAMFKAVMGSVPSPQGKAESSPSPWLLALGLQPLQPHRCTHHSYPVGSSFEVHLAHAKSGTPPSTHLLVSLRSETPRKLPKPAR